MNQISSPQSLDYFSYAREPVLPFLPQSCKRLLDVGCGAAAFGGLVRERLGAEVWGVEPHREAALAAEGKIDTVVNAMFDHETDLPENYFDVIVFNDSLEHFPYPEPPLDAAKKFLAPGGTVVASIPNVRYFENIKHLLVDMDWEYRDQGILDRTHLRFFTRKSMIRTFEEAGYTIHNIEGINSHYWSGMRIALLKLFFGRWMADMRYLQYVVVAQPN